MKIKVYQSREDNYIEMEVIGEYRYLGGLDIIDLIKGKIYKRVGNLEEFRIVDDSEEDYLYPEYYFEKVY